MMIMMMMTMTTSLLVQVQSSLAISLRAERDLEQREIARPRFEYTLKV